MKLTEKTLVPSKNDPQIKVSSLNLKFYDNLEELAKLILKDDLSLTHYADAPFDFEEKIVDQQFIGSLPDIKPRGFWVSCDNEDETWKTFCETDFTSRSIEYEYDVKVKKNSSILHLKTLDELKLFNETFAEEKLHFLSKMINWIDVSKYFDGIIISPYQWSYRYKTWYYGWDCASGCIWNCKKLIVTPKGKF